MIQCTGCLPSETMPPVDDLRVSVALPGPAALWDANRLLFPWLESFDDIINAFLVGSQGDSTPADHEDPSRMTPGNEPRSILPAETPPVVMNGGVPPVATFASDAAPGPDDNFSVDVVQVAESREPRRSDPSLDVACRATDSTLKRPPSPKGDMAPAEQIPPSSQRDTNTSVLSSKSISPSPALDTAGLSISCQPPAEDSWPPRQELQALSAPKPPEGCFARGTQPSAAVHHPSVRLDGRIGEPDTPSSPAPRQMAVTLAATRGFNSFGTLSKGVHSLSPMTLRGAEACPARAGATPGESPSPLSAIPLRLASAPPLEQARARDSAKMLLGGTSPAAPVADTGPGGPTRTGFLVSSSRERTSPPRLQASISPAGERRPLGNRHNLPGRPDVESPDRSPRPLAGPDIGPQVHFSGDVRQGEATRFALAPALIARHIVQRLAAEPHPGVMNIQIQLDPPALGRVDIRLTIDGRNTVHAALRTELPAALHAIHAVTPHIRSALENHGFHVAGLDVSSGMPLDVGGHPGGGMPQHHDQPPFPTSEAGPPVMAAVQATRAAEHTRQKSLAYALRLVDAVA